MPTDNTEIKAQMRVPPGVPAGGQFAERRKPEPTDELDVSSSRMPGGTFDYPEPTHGVEEHILFWDTVDVPDDVLDQVAAAYSAGRDSWASEKMHEFDVHYDRTHPERTAQEHVDADRQAEWDRLGAQFPPELDPSTVRTTTRAYRMLVLAHANLSPADVQRVLNHRMPWTDRERPERTVKEIVAGVQPAWNELGAVLDPRHPDYSRRRGDADDELADIAESTARTEAELRELRADNQVLLEELGNFNNTTHDGAAAVQESVDRLTKKFVAPEIFRRRN